MKKSRFTEPQSPSILKEANAGLKVSEICRKQGISDATYYNWKARYGEIAVSDLERMKELETEPAQLKRLDVDLTPENRAMKDLIEKSSQATEKRDAAKFMIESKGLSAPGSCRSVGLLRGACYRASAD